MWAFNSVCQSKARLVGKTVVITGANSGTGKETARDLYKRGARVILACRNLEKANEAIEDIKKTPILWSEKEQFQGERGELAACKLNLCSFASVRECAKLLSARESMIHLLINNAVVNVSTSYRREKTDDGNELHFQTNYLGHFLLTLLLLPKLASCTPGIRIMNVSSVAHKNGQMHFDNLNMEEIYTPVKAYEQSKLANVLFTKELTHRLKEAGIEGVSTYAPNACNLQTDQNTMHVDNTTFPGMRLAYQLAQFCFQTAESGAQNSIHCAVDEAAARQTGLYYEECKPTIPAPQANNREDAKKLWTTSLKFVGLPPQENLAELMNTIAKDILPVAEVNKENQNYSKDHSSHLPVGKVV